MVEMKHQYLEERELPPQVDYYVISESGTVRPAGGASADVYIGELDVRCFSDTETMLYIRSKYGERIGVMRDRDYQILPREFKTTKLLLGVVKSNPSHK